MSSDMEHLTRYSRTRDAEAFAALVRRYQDFVYSACLRVLGDAGDAEDAAQECFLALAQKAGTVNVSVAGWLHRHATQHCVDRVRSDASRARREREYGEMRMSKENGDAGEAAWDEIAPEVDRAVNGLPDELRHVLIEHFLRQRSQSEVAEELGASPATISRRVRDGVDEVRKALKRAGIVAPAAVLATLLWENSVHAAPATLGAALGRMAIAGVGRPTVVAGRDGSARKGRGLRAVLARKELEMKGLSIAAAVVGLLGLFMGSAALISAPEGAGDVRAELPRVKAKLSALDESVGEATSAAEAASKEAAKVSAELRDLSDRIARLEHAVARAAQARPAGGVDESRVREIVRAAVREGAARREGAAVRAAPADRAAGGRRADARGRVDMTAQLRERMGLDEPTAEKVSAKLTTMGEEIREMWRENRGGDRDQLRERMREITAKTEKEIEGMLTPEQAAKYKEAREEMRQRREDRRGGRGGRRERPGGGEAPQGAAPAGGGNEAF